MERLKQLVAKFEQNIEFYKDNRNAYNEHSCRIEYIDPLLECLGWDVSNSKGALPQYREVIAENFSNQSDRPDYSLTLNGVVKLFVEAKKPSVDISVKDEPAIQTRKYGWNAGHKISVLTNFEYLIIYDTTVMPKVSDKNTVARYKIYNFREYIEKYDEIFTLLSKESVYSGRFDEYYDNCFSNGTNDTLQVDDYFLKQINDWRVSLSNELYSKGGRYTSIDVLNDVVQEFINQIIFLRICEDRNLPLYHKLSETIVNESELHERLVELFIKADARYNSGLFSGPNIIFDLNSNVIREMVEKLYYPQSPYMFNIIEPNMLGKIYEMFLTEQLIISENNNIELSKKKECKNRSVVTTPEEIVRYMVDLSLSRICKDKSPDEILKLKIADIACGSGVFLEAVFDYLQEYCVSWYLNNDIAHLEMMENGIYKLPLSEKKKILTSCIFGIDIDIHAVEVAKFSMLIKLIEDETAPSVTSDNPILPDLCNNIFFGNSLVSNEELSDIAIHDDDYVTLVPFDWNEMNVDAFDLIVGNPPYVNTEDMHDLLPESEFNVYKKKYKTSYKQFDKYFIFLERAISKIKAEGYLCYIVPNKFFKIGAGEKLRQMLASLKCLIRLDDFGDAQLFAGKTTYSSILLIQKAEHDIFTYSKLTTVKDLRENENVVEMKSSILNKLPWRLTTDFDFLRLLNKIDEVAVPITTHAEIFNGIQTSAERPDPVYWFADSNVVEENSESVVIEKLGKKYEIEKSILRPYFKPTQAGERGLNSYSVLETDKRIIFPYNDDGTLIEIEIMKNKYVGTYNYLLDYYNRLVPKSVSDIGVRDVPNATKDTWYQYGRTQALTAFINTPKLIVGILSRDPMYAYDTDDMLISSGGTAGYCAIKRREGSPYELEYLQAWLTNRYTERILEIVGSDFEGGFTSRGTFVLSTLPFVELDFEDSEQKGLHDRVVQYSREIYRLNGVLANNPSRSLEQATNRRKKELIDEIDMLISKVYTLKFLN